MNWRHPYNFRTPSHTELLRSSGAEDNAPRNIILRGAEDNVPRNNIFRVTEEDVPRADFHPPCGCSVGVPGAEDYVPRSIVFRVGVPSEFRVRKTMFRGI